jgi:hypothetical protein
MCGLPEEWPGELQRLVARPVVEQEGYGVTENLAQWPTSQVPEVLCPYALDGVACHELRLRSVSMR